MVEASGSFVGEPDACRRFDLFSNEKSVDGTTCSRVRRPNLRRNDLNLLSDDGQSVIYILRDDIAFRLNKAQQLE